MCTNVFLLLIYPKSAGHSILCPWFFFFVYPFLVFRDDGNDNDDNNSNVSTHTTKFSNKMQQFDECAQRSEKFIATHHSIHLLLYRAHSPFSLTFDINIIFLFCCRVIAAVDCSSAHAIDIGSITANVWVFGIN